MITNTPDVIQTAYKRVDNNAARVTAAAIRPFIDLTDLSDQPSNLEALIAHAAKDPAMAGVCLHPQWIAEACKLHPADTVPFKWVTVANFPNGRGSLNLGAASDCGAIEIDVVFPYHAFLKGEIDLVQDFLARAREETSGKTLKVILETAALESVASIQHASRLCIEAEVDFLKTSTGKLKTDAVNFDDKTGASFEAAIAILTAIQASGEKTCGFKASGGIRDLHTAAMYIELARVIMGDAWVTPEVVRVGSSQFF